MNKLIFGKDRPHARYYCHTCPNNKPSKPREEMHFITEWVEKVPVRRAYCKEHYDDRIAQLEGVRSEMLFPYGNTGVTKE